MYKIQHELIAEQYIHFPNPKLLFLSDILSPSFQIPHLYFVSKFPNPIPLFCVQVSKSHTFISDIRRNVIIYNLTEEVNEDLSKKVIDLLGELGEDSNVITYYRFGTRNSQGNRLVCIILNSKEAALRLIEKKRFKNVFIRNDMTSNELLHARKENHHFWWLEFMIGVAFQSQDLWSRLLFVMIGVAFQSLDLWSLLLFVDDGLGLSTCSWDCGRLQFHTVI